MVDSACSSPSIETATVDTTISMDTLPSQPTAASNVDEVQSPQAVRPSCFASILPTVSPDGVNSTKDHSAVDSTVVLGSRRGRCRSADRQEVGDGKGQADGPGRRGQLTPVHVRRVAWRRRSVSLDSTRFRYKLQQLLMLSPPMADVTSNSDDKGAFNGT